MLIVNQLEPRRLAVRCKRVVFSLGWRANRNGLELETTLNRSAVLTFSHVALATLFLAVYTPGVAQAPNERAAKDWVELYEPHADDEMPYRLMKPIAFDPTKRYPVIVSLHGGGGRGKDNRKQLRDWNRPLAQEQLRTDYPSYVLAPQATHLWDAAHLSKIQDVIAALPSVDTDRIYVLGHSMGGHGAFILIQIDPGYFAAAAPSAGTGRPGTEKFIDASLIKDIPSWAFHGDKDKVAPFERAQKLFAEMKQLEANMKFTTWVGDDHGHGVTLKMITGGDNGNTQFSSNRCNREPEFMKWLFSQSLADGR